MTTQLSLYNNALALLGERSLASLSESREARRRLDAAWSRPAIDDCLSKGQWKFAMRTLEIACDPNFTTQFGYQYAFTRPADLIRVTSLCSDEYFNSPLLRYQTEGAYWFADVEPIYVRYVSNDASYGGDLSLWPQNFCRYVEAYLADAIVEATVADKSMWQKVRALMKDNLTNALSTDAMEDPTAFPPSGAWVSARRGRSSRDRGKRSSLIG